MDAFHTIPNSQKPSLSMLYVTRSVSSCAQQRRQDLVCKSGPRQGRVWNTVCCKYTCYFTPSLYLRGRLGLISRRRDLNDQLSKLLAFLHLVKEPIYLFDIVGARGGGARGGAGRGRARGRGRGAGRGARARGGPRGRGI